MNRTIQKDQDKKKAAVENANYNSLGIKLV